MKAPAERVSSIADRVEGQASMARVVARRRSSDRRTAYERD
jgi:hypothetical protein